MTRAWNDLIADGVVRPIERQAGGVAVVADDTQVRLARHLLDDLHRHAGVLSPQTLGLLHGHVDPEFDATRLRQGLRRMQEAGLDHEDQVAQVTTLLGRSRYLPGLSERGDVDLERTLELRQAILAGQPSRAYTEPGELMRQYGLGSPAVAYGVGGGALALALQAALGLKNESAPGGGGAVEPGADVAFRS
ncbi:MAG: hypothetical protein WBN89_12895 [Prochlorococcaceae cyanobacterium]